MKPWDDIGNPETEDSYSVRLADPMHIFDFFWGKNITGQYVFRFFGDFDSGLSADAPKMSGITTIGGIENNRSHLTLVLEDNEDANIFYMLCRSLMHTTENLPQGNDTSAVRMILTQLQRWQRLLQNRRSKELSLNEQVGLFGELLILKDFYLDNLDAEPAVLCWTGPLGDEQDFSYNLSLVEVKTTRASRDRRIKISSVDQLDSVSGKITLAFQTLAHTEKEEHEALSLNKLVTNLKEIIQPSGTEAVELFEMRLLMMGYETLPSYDKYFFTPVSRQFFTVEDEFPRLCAADIPEGVTDVSYSLSVDSCMPWLINEDQFLNKVFKSDE